MEQLRSMPLPRPEPLSHFVLFWLLSGMSLATALPCLLFPAVDGWRRLSDIEHQEAQKAAVLQTTLENQEKLKEALRSDPMLNQRIAQRELRYRYPGTEQYVHGVSSVVVTRESIAQRHNTLPEWTTHLYNGPFASVFHVDKNRTILLCASMSLLVAAFLLFNRR